MYILDVDNKGRSLEDKIYKTIMNLGTSKSEKTARTILSYILKQHQLSVIDVINGFANEDLSITQLNCNIDKKLIYVNFYNIVKTYLYETEGNYENGIQFNERDELYLMNYYSDLHQIMKWLLFSVDKGMASRFIKIMYNTDYFSLPKLVANTLTQLGKPLTEQELLITVTDVSLRCYAKKVMKHVESTIR